MSHDEMVRSILAQPVQMAWLQAALALAPLVGKLAGKIAGNRSEARVAETALNNQQDKLAIDRSQIEQDARFAEQANAKQNALLAGLQDYSVTRPEGVPTGRATGGLRPSAIKGGSALGQQFSDASLAKLMSGVTPELTPIQKPGKFDKLLNIVNFIGGGIGLANSLKGSKPLPSVTPTVSTDPMSVLKNLPSLSPDAIAVTPPAKGSFYKPPTFTRRF